MRESPPALRPLSVADLVDEIFRLYRRNFALLFAVAALVSLPTAILFVGGVAVAGPFARTPAGPLTPADLEDLFSGFEVLFVGLLVLAVTFPLLLGAITDATAKRYLGLPTTIGESLRTGLSRYLPILGGYLLIVLAFLGLFGVTGVVVAVAVGVIGGVVGALVSVVATIGLLVPMVWLAVTWSLMPQAIVVEGKGPLGGLRRSAELVAGSRWRVIGINLLLQLVGVVLLAVPSQFLTLLVLPLPLPFNVEAAFSQLIAAIAQTLYRPIELGTIALLYFDLRVRREGFDLALAAESLREPVPAPGS